MSAPELDCPLSSASRLPADRCERQDLAASFRPIVDFLPDVVIITGADGKIVLVNTQAERTFGWEEGELLGQSINALIPARFHSRHCENYAAYVAAPRVRPMGAVGGIVALRKDGSEFPAEISLGPLDTGGGGYIVCVIRDITEKKLAIDALREQEAQLLAAQRIQECLLPQSAPMLPGFDIAGACHPAEFASGDYFDYLPMTGGAMGLAIADVSGHGFASALLMSAVQSHLRALVERPRGTGRHLAPRERAPLGKGRRGAVRHPLSRPPRSRVAKAGLCQHRAPAGVCPRRVGQREIGAHQHGDHTGFVFRRRIPADGPFGPAARRPLAPADRRHRRGRFAGGNVVWNGARARRRPRTSLRPPPARSSTFCTARSWHSRGGTCPATT